MNCPHCQQENTAGSRFCESCGAALESACGSCGAAISGTARFCQHCGQRVEMVAVPEGSSASAEAPVAFEQTSGERRQLSVMFCDLVGSTELGQRLDPEDLREVGAR